MKKLILLLFFISLFICGCKEEYDPKEQESSEDILNTFLQSLDIPEETETNLNLLSTYEIKTSDNRTVTINATWESINPDLISNDGTINRLVEDSIASINVVFSLEDATLENEYTIIIKGIGYDKLLENVLDSIVLPSSTYQDLSLPSPITYNGNNYRCSWKSSNTKVVTNSGNVYPCDTDQIITLTATINYMGYSKEKEFPITILKFDNEAFQTAIPSLLTIPTLTKENITLITSITLQEIDFSISWKSSNQNIMTNNGEIYLSSEDQSVSLIATFTSHNLVFQKEYIISIPKASTQDKFNYVINNLLIPEIIYYNLSLPTTFDYEISGSWQSSNEEILTNTGVIQNFSETPITLTLTLYLEGEKITVDYPITIKKADHMYLDTTWEGQLENVQVVNNKLLLDDDKLIGTYTTKQISTLYFTDMVASWSAISSKYATCEIEVRLYVDGQWSNYVSYVEGGWGLGLENKAVDQSNSLIKLSTDEVIVLNNKQASAFQIKATLRRTALSYSSPILSLLAATLNFVNYSFPIEQSSFPDTKTYDVPKLYQHDVPEIGNIICSPTSSTMLLKYKGHSFTSEASLEHQYIALMAKDYGNNIFGNWVFNCVCMSAFGENSYVKRFYSWQETFLHLSSVGPIAASIKGTVRYTQNNVSGSYTTSGHLIVVTGYKITPTNTTVYINDPNVRGVSIEMNLDDFMTVWRNIGYVVE